MQPKVKLKEIYNVNFILKNLQILLYIMFLIILSMTDNKESGLLFEHNSYDSFLCTGITLANFSMDGRTPNEKDRLNISAR